MHYTVEGVDKASGIRDKAKQIVELVSDPAKLEEEREFARKNRDKFKGFSNSDPTPRIGGGSGQYTGFGSKDLEKMGGADAYRPGGSYDPYKKDSIFAEKPIVEKKEPTEKSKKKWKHKKKKESSSSDEESSEEESDASEEEEEKPKRFKKKKQGSGLTKPPKKGEKSHPQTLQETPQTFTHPAQPKQESLLDMFDPMSQP